MMELIRFEDLKKEYNDLIEEKALIIKAWFTHLDLLNPQVFEREYPSIIKGPIYDNQKYYPFVKDHCSFPIYSPGVTREDIANKLAFFNKNNFMTFLIYIRSVEGRIPNNIGRIPLNEFVAILKSIQNVNKDTGKPDSFYTVSSVDVTSETKLAKVQNLASVLKALDFSFQAMDIDSLKIAQKSIARSLRKKGV